MEFSLTALAKLSLDFVEEIDTITQKTEQFLKRFQAEAQIRFSDAAQIKKQYLAPYAELVTSLVSSLERSDALGVRLSALFAAADCQRAVEHMPRVEHLWTIYEQYRTDLCEFLASSQHYFSNQELLNTKGTAPIVLATRTLVASQMRAKECFVKESI
jgi:hypothetical protein